jgi:hypothetical protein
MITIRGLVTKRESFWEDTFPVRSKDGERWFLSRALPIRDADSTSGLTRQSLPVHIVAESDGVQVEAVHFQHFNRRFVDFGAAFIDYDYIAGRRIANVDCDLAGNIFRDFFCLLLILAIHAVRIFDLITVHNLEMKLGHRLSSSKRIRTRGDSSRCQDI